MSRARGLVAAVVSHVVVPGMGRIALAHELLRHLPDQQVVPTPGRGHVLDRQSAHGLVVVGLYVGSAVAAFAVLGIRPPRS